MRVTHTRTALLLVAGLLAACDSGGNAAPDTLGTTPPTASVPGSTTTVALGSTTSTVAATVPEGAVALSADGPWTLVDSAPGVTQPGLVYSLMPGLWVYLPVEEDIENGITWVLNEQDLPVIEAYLMARLTFFRATQQRPIDLDDPGWKRDYSDGGEQYRTILLEHSNRGEAFDLDAGIVLRPVVIGEERTDVYAIVTDCMLDGSTWRQVDGSLGQDSTLGTAPNGLAAAVEALNGDWVVSKVATQPEVCS